MEKSSLFWSIWWTWRSRLCWFSSR